MIGDMEEYDSILISLPPGHRSENDQYWATSTNNSIILTTSSEQQNGTDTSTITSSAMSDEKCCEIAEERDTNTASLLTVPADSNPSTQSTRTLSDRQGIAIPKVLDIEEIYRNRIYLALYMYYHYEYPLYQPPDQSTRTLSLKNDIKLASRIPNRLQESFEDRIIFLLNEHGFLLSQDVVLRPADSTDVTWQQLLRVHHQISTSEKDREALQAIQAKFEEEGEEEEEADDEDSFRSVFAQSAGAYLFTTLLPVTLGFTSAAALSIPTLAIAACIGAVAGQVTWDSIQQQKLLYPPQHYATAAATTAAPSTSTEHNAPSPPSSSLSAQQPCHMPTSSFSHPPPPTYPPALRLWRQTVYTALALSPRALEIQEQTVTFFTQYWLNRQFPSGNIGDQSISIAHHNQFALEEISSNHIKARRGISEEVENDWEVISDVPASMSSSIPIAN